MAETKAPLLTKAASVANHIARLDKATADFSGKMAAMHKAHHEDMSKALGQLGKVIGLDVAGSGPDPVDLEGLGTENIQSFKAELNTMVAEAIRAEVAKLMKGVEKEKTLELEKKTELEKKVCPTCSKSMEDCKCASKVEKGAEVTEEGLNKAFEGLLVKMDELVAKRVESSMTEFAKAMYEPLDDSTDARNHFDTNTPGQVPIHKVAPTTGVGDRTQLPQPIVRVPTEVSKGAGAEEVSTPLSSDLAKKALSGDQNALREFMKSATPSAVPVTLTEALQKIH